MNFSSLGLSDPLLKAVKNQGYTTPTPIQLQAIPIVLSGKDLMAAAQTGTGKTAGFILPILEMLSKNERNKSRHIRVLVLTPTRELAAQIDQNTREYSKYLPLSSTTVFGGVKIQPQINQLKHGIDILVATPGRLLDLYNQGAVKFQNLEILVLDEADRMLDMGFIHDIKKILALLPAKRQNLLFSATFSDDIRALAKSVVHNPMEVSVATQNTTADTVEQWIYPVEKNKKSELLTHLIKENNWSQVLVFSRTKHGANKLTRQLESRGIQATAIHGNRSQSARTKALQNFKSGQVRILVATDIAARGLDIEQLPNVVNFDLPHVPQDYVHRIGRTGRAGSTGQAISLVCMDEAKQLFDIEKFIGQKLTRKSIDAFKPAVNLPESHLPKHQAKKNPHTNVNKTKKNRPRNQNPELKYKPKAFVRNR